MALLLLLWIGLFVTRRLRWVPTSLDRPVLALLVAALASAVASPWRLQSLPLVLLLALTVLVGIQPAARAIRERPDALAAIVAVWIAGAVLAALWGIRRAPGDWPNGASTPLLGRTALGTKLAAGVALTLSAWGAWDRRWTRAALAAGQAVIVAGLVLTTSRSAWIAAAAGAAVAIGLAPWRRAAILALSAGAVALAVFAVRADAERGFLGQRLRSIPDIEVNADRTALWLGALRMVRDHPLLGTGYGTFLQAWPQYHSDPALDGKPTAHNIFLNFAAETGLLGLAAFLAVLAAGFAGLWRRVQAARGAPRDLALWAAVFAATVAIMVQQLFDGTVLSWHLGYAVVAGFALGSVLPDTSTPL
jgi:O-antigen ligase